MRDDAPPPDTKTTVRMKLNTDPPTDPQPVPARIEFQLSEILSDMKHLRLWALRQEAQKAKKWYHLGMKLDLTLVHYLTLVAGALAAGLPQLEAAFPPSATPWLKGSAAVFVLLASVLGVLSPSAALSKSTTPSS